MTDLDPRRRESILKGFAFYRDAPPDQQSIMLGAARYVLLGPGDRLFQEGEPANHFAVVGTGSIRVFRTGATGRQITLYHVRANQSSLVSMVSVLLGEPAVATAQAEVETEVVVVSVAALREWVSASEAVRTFIFETVGQALVDVTSLLEDVAFRTMDSRLAVLLLQHADAAHAIRMRHEDIAAELGSAREVVSRLLEGFERSGAISLSRGRIEIRDEEALRRLANNSV